MTEIYPGKNFQQSSQICNMLTKNIGWYLNGSYKNLISYGKMLLLNRTELSSESHALYARIRI